MNGRKVGRPRAEVDPNMVKSLAAIGCTMEEVGGAFGCSHQTIRNNYLAEYKLGYAAFKKSLRRWQYERAQRGSDAMLIHLGNNYLGQTNKNENKNETTVQIAEFVRIHDAKPSEDDPLDI